MWQLNTLEANLQTIRKSSIMLREKRAKLLSLPNPSDEDRAEIEELRVEINSSRKEERSLSSRIKQMRSN